MVVDDEQVRPLIGIDHHRHPPGYGTTLGAADVIASNNSLTVGRVNHNQAAGPPPPRSDDDPLLSDSPKAAPPASPYLQTFTAGEEGSRLASAAREMGLARRRVARAPVRSRDYEGRAKLFFTETFRRIVFEEECRPPEEDEKGSDFWETLAGVAGNVLEWYDFAVFGYFGDVIGQVFFPPNQSGNANTMESFMVFGGAFLMRPVGGVLLGYLGDVYGRRKALYVSIFLMAWPTFLMGCLPSFETAGYFAPVMLVLIRCLQGMSVGGQLMSSLVFTLENVPRDRWGLYGSFVWATGNFGVLLGGLVGYAIRANLDHDQLVSYGWRIPFLSGVVVSFAGFYLRSAEEEAEAEADKQGGARGKLEAATSSKKDDLFAAIFRPENIRPLLAASMVPMIWSAGFYLSFVWMAVYMSTLIDDPVPNAFAINSVSLFIGVCVLFPIAGWLSDRYGRRLIMSMGATSLALLGPTLLRLIGNGGGDPLAAFAAQLFLGVCLSFWGSPMGAWLTESFEPEARLTSVSLGYNVAHAIVGGSTPAVATYLVDAKGPEAPGWIYVAVSVVGMIGLWVVAPPPPPPRNATGGK